MTHRARLFAAVAIAALAAPVATASQQPGDTPSWEELRARPYPAWFRDAKLGIFIHWGVYSVPAYSNTEDYGEWFLRGLNVGDTLRTRFMRENFGADFEYRDFGPLFRAELFDPDEWADLFRRAGARYVVLVSKHHDGYALWPSAQAPGWNSVDVGPGRDLVGELTESVRDAGLRMGLYYSLAEWGNEIHDWYVDPPEEIGPYVERHMIPQLKDLITRYEPVVLFTDGEWLNSAEQWHARELIDWYFDTVGPDAVVNDRWGGGANIGFITPEYSAGIEPTDRPWAEVRGLGRSFALNRKERLEAYMTPEQLVHRFARAVAAGGGMILNVGPKADGQIPLLQQERLVQLGEWLAVNGEAIYGTEPWTRTGEDRPIAVTRVDANIDFDWVRNSPVDRVREDDFTAEWTGWIEAPATGTYRFEVEADDAMRLWIDGELVVDEWGDAPEVEASGAEEALATHFDADPARVAAGAEVVRLEAGRRVALRAAFRETTHQAVAKLLWTRPDGVREIIPANALFTDPDRGAPAGLLATYRSLERHVVYTRKDDDVYAITIEWPDGELALPVAEPAAGTRIRLLGLDGPGAELPWRWSEGSLRIDFSGVAYRDIPGAWAWAVRIEGFADPGGR